MNKKTLSERDICTKFIVPALVKAGWDVQTQVREEVNLTKGRVMVSGRVHRRGEAKRADFLLDYTRNLPLAIIEAKDNNHPIGAGMQQALGYADILKDVPFVFSSNGDGFLFHDRTVKSGPVEKELALDEFPSPEELWRRYCASRDVSAAIEAVVAQDYYPSPENKTPRYYQLTAINRTIEAIAKGQNRVLLVMATGTGKTFVAFQIIWRLWNPNQASGPERGVKAQMNGEQKRIVARVEELLRRCDTLEAQLHQTRTRGAHLLDSTLHHLLTA